MRAIKTTLWMIILMLCSSLTVFAYDFEVDGIYYDIISSEDLTCKVVSGTNKYEGDVKIPVTVPYKNRTLKVTEIGPSAFNYCKSLTSIEIPNSVEEIGSFAFYYCSSLTSVKIPSSVTVIGRFAFTHCSGLTSIVIPNLVTEIGEIALGFCTSLTSVVISKNVTKIESRTFEGCSSLTSIEIPSSVKEIRFKAFSGCSSLASLVIPGSVTQIGDDAFSDLSTLIVEEGENKLSYVYSVRYSSNETYYYPVKKLTKLIAKRYISIILSAKYNDVFPNVTDLYIDNFELNSNTICYNVKNLTLGKNATIDSNLTLSGCEDLESLTLENPIPPVNYPNCSAKQYTDVILYVPKGSLAAYQAAEGWKKFWDIREVESSGIEETDIDNNIQEIGRYNLQGQAVTDDYRGLIIVKYSDGTVKKVLNR